MLKCKDVAELASRYVDNDLGVMQRTQMRLHLMMCKHCSRYVRQIRETVSLLGAIGRRDTDSRDDERFIELGRQQKR